MKKTYLILVAAIGFLAATMLSTQVANANYDSQPSKGSCVGDAGLCGITVNGTLLIGKWAE
jgi:hypothetical protein